MRVLLCDDAAEMRALLRWTLERSGELDIVGEVADSTSALELIARMELDVVLLDLQMPVLSPGELLRAIAQIAPALPIVTFSGFEPEVVAPDAARLVTLHIPKTTDLQLVREAVRDVAAQR